MLITSTCSPISSQLVSAEAPSTFRSPGTPIKEAQIEIRNKCHECLLRVHTATNSRVFGSLESRTIPSDCGWSESDRGPSAPARSTPPSLPPANLPASPATAKRHRASLAHHHRAPPSMPRVGGGWQQHRLKIPFPGFPTGPRTLISITTRNHPRCGFAAYKQDGGSEDLCGVIWNHALQQICRPVSPSDAAANADGL